MAQRDDSIECDDVTYLPKLFKDGLDLFNNLGKSDEPTDSLQVQCNVKRCIKIFEKVTVLVSYSGIFSKNEDIDEIATADLQYFLIPAILGTLHLKLTSGARNNIVEVTEVYFEDFIKRCNDYNLCDYEFKKKEGTDSSESLKTVSNECKMEELTVLARQRALKIRRYKECQELKEQLSTLKTNMENEHADEDIKRNYFLTMIQLYIREAIDELSSIELEKSVLEYIKNNKDYEKPKKKRPSKPLQPVIITKDAVQKAVFGSGYPSLPTMTVQEFYDKRVKEGVFPDPTKCNNQKIFSLQESASKGISVLKFEEECAIDEEKIEKEDEEHINVLRRKDEFKDDHRRGSGNRFNRS